MADLLTGDDVAAFEGAIRDVTDTFFRYPVALERESGDVPLLCGRKQLAGDLKPREEGNEVDEAFELRFHREYLREEGLVDEDDVLLIGIDDTFLLDGKRFHIAGKLETAFRDGKLMVVIQVVR